MGRAAVLGVAMAATIATHLAGAQPTAAKRLGPDPNLSYTYRILNNPTTGDAFGFRSAIHGYAQKRSDGLFRALEPLLGGASPQLNFLPTGSPLVPTTMSANVVGKPGAPQGTINVDPLAVETLINDHSPYHDSGVNGYPHEMSHLRQSRDTLAQFLTREGGAQAFANLVTPTAAQRAGIPYRPGNFDGDYAPFVQAVQAAPYGRDWILAGQFGRSGSPAWP